MDLTSLSTTKFDVFKTLLGVALFTLIGLMLIRYFIPNEISSPWSFTLTGILIIFAIYGMIFFFSGYFDMEKRHNFEIKQERIKSITQKLLIQKELGFKVKKKEEIRKILDESIQEDLDDLKNY